MENFPKKQIEGDINFDKSDLATFEVDALTYKIMEGAPELSFEEASKKARQAIRESKEEDTSADE